jgi:hypothetical protein
MKKIVLSILGLCLIAGMAQAALFHGGRGAIAMMPLLLNDSSLNLTDDSGNELTAQ